MKKPIYLAGVLASGIMLFGCANASPEKAADDGGYAAALADTNAAIKKAASVGGEWRDIRWKKSKGNLMKKAAAAAKAGDTAKALKILMTAKTHAELGYQQAMEQKNAGPRF